MNIKILAAIAVSGLLAMGANGQGAGGAGAGGTAGAGTSGANGGSIGTSDGVNTAPGNPGVVNPGINSGVITPVNPNQGSVNIPPPLNPNTPVVGQGMPPNNLNLGSNNLGLGSNNFRLGSNQFALRTNGLGTNFLTPTGPNGSRVLSNNVFVNPTAGTNAILLRP